MAQPSLVGAPPLANHPGPAATGYRHAHWYFLAALAVTVAGFWPSFFATLGARTPWHNLHGITATLWLLILATQSWLVSRGHRNWHRRVALLALLVVLPALVASALYMVGVLQHNRRVPAFMPPFLSFIDLCSIAFLLVLVTLALLNIRNPAAHKRFMAATALLGLPPALSRLYLRLAAGAVPPFITFHASLLTVELVLVALIIADRRAGQRHLAYPLSLGFFVVIQLLIGPVSSSAPWRQAMAWYGSLPIFSAESLPEAGITP